ncbi:hypothetical protein LOZ80_11935 [Paenibacillus sp. HWE-109]|uniref:hypothetical protein n=1 Tax=Paenibacillus sp. HWE-109 TaxID=1306526 RepID=UPI001EE0BCCF|nr:hypothetical protein [Paenibacillus sp. HWE-109]UKS29595.1 hypothetical protein LOZ80_11935 [Paenibacillus sp. HWE-109]
MNAVKVTKASANRAVVAVKATGAHQLIRPVTDLKSGQLCRTSINGQEATPLV